MSEVNQDGPAVRVVEPEIITADEARPQREPVRFVSRQSLFKWEGETLELPEGLTISEQMAAGGLNPKLAPWFHVAIDGVAVAPQWWDRVKPKAGRTVTVSVLPRGGGGGGGGGGQQEDDNKTLRMVLQIVVIIAATIITAYLGGVGGAIVGALFAAAGQLSLAALQPPSGSPLAGSPMESAP